MIVYDPSVVRTFAQQLYDRAATVIGVHCLVGLLIGGALGRFTFGTVGMTLMALCGMAVGYFLGAQKAFLLKLQAQTSLCHVQIEENTRGGGGGDRKTLPATAPAAVSSDPMKARASDDAGASGATNKPMGSCPSCDAVIALGLQECPRCRAAFGRGSAWQIVPLAPEQR